MLKKVNETYMELLFGIILYGILLLIVCSLLLPNNRTPYIMGAVLGITVSIFLSVHLFITIDKSLDMNEKGAVNYTRCMTILRLFIMLLALILTLYLPTIFHTITVILGIMGLKISAYLQPITHRFVKPLVCKYLINSRNT